MKTTSITWEEIEASPEFQHWLKVKAEKARAEFYAREKRKIKKKARDKRNPKKTY